VQQKDTTAPPIYLLAPILLFLTSILSIISPSASALKPYAPARLQVCALNQAIPPHYLRLGLTTNLLVSIREHPNILVYDSFFNCVCTHTTHTKYFKLIRAFLSCKYLLNLQKNPSLFPPSYFFNPFSWTPTAPNVIQDLLKLPKKSINANVNRTHFLEILNSFSNAVLCVTDGS